MIAQLWNPMLVSALIAWFLGQALKPPIHFLAHHKWNWDLLKESGGMPSSHSALVSSTTLAIGLDQGFDHPAFIVALMFAFIVIYDATHVRLQAGIHAERLNFIFEELFNEKHTAEEKLREVLGHTPMQVFFGILLGVSISILIHYIW